jgi:leucyl aminopeptidase
LTEDLKKNKVLNTYENGSRVMYLLQEKPFTPDSVFKIAERAVPRAKTSKCKKIVVEICENPQPKKEEGKDEPVQEEKEVPKCPKEVLAQLPLAFRLANYKFEHKTVEDEKNSNVEEVTFTGAYASDIYKSELFSFYDVMGQAKNNARDLANGRPNMLNTEYFLEKAKLLAAEHPQVRLKYIYGDELEKEGLETAPCCR